MTYGQVKIGWNRFGPKCPIERGDITITAMVLCEGQQETKYDVKRDVKQEDVSETE